MQEKYPIYKGLNLPEIAEDLLNFWETQQLFKRSVEQGPADKPFVFFEGPPSANGLPGIHHVMARSIKDIFCRYKTLKGYRVNRKAGWDTHGLPVELGVEKELGITKEDIGTKISVEDYNKACREAVMRYTDVWNDLTRKMGYWVDMDDPYITYESKYMESVWWLLGQLWEKGLLYKGYTIQPYSPKAGTGLSSHELNQPGCYRDVTDTTVVAQFKVRDVEKLPFELNSILVERTYFLAWTTTPWTLPSNTALCVGPKIEYVLVKSFNQYTYAPVCVVLAKNLLNTLFSKTYQAVDDEAALTNYQAGDKTIPYYVAGACLGADLIGMRYEQLLPYTLPADQPDQAFQVIGGDFVTTDDGTGVVHIAPTFGSDDARVANESGVPAMLVDDGKGNRVPLVDLQGRFRPELAELAGMYVKNEYYPEGEAPEKSVDVLIAIRLKEENKAFKVEKYVHSYPHCWRTDKPVLYYPLDSWFIEVTKVRTRMMELNDSINWKPESTGSGRFGKWLENANDWNLSRSRYWGIPIPIWSTEDGSERICISSVDQLKTEVDKAVSAGFMPDNPLKDFVSGDNTDANYARIDLHKNEMDQLILCSLTGQAMRREADLIDVWFDSGSMPYAQWHYPFENNELIDKHLQYPADFIAEGVDQTRGWFYTLHAISTMVFDSVAFKNVVSNGLVLDKNGQKMSKRLGNAIDPFTTLEKYGPDATRWYMITNAQPWDNLKFDLEGIAEVQRKFFGTLYNTYSFFALYANIDGFDHSRPQVPHAERPEIDRWIVSRLHSLIKQVEESFDQYEPTRAGRLIQEFVNDHLSNWYVRLCRRRYWKQATDDLAGEQDKLAAYQTLYSCLETVAVLASPIAPFFADRLWKDLKLDKTGSVHLSEYPTYNPTWIDEQLERRMDVAQRASSLVLALRKKEKIRVRQPLQKIVIPALSEKFEQDLMHVRDLILSEVNVKELQVLHEGNGVLVKRIKPNFKTIGPKYGKLMKEIATLVSTMNSEAIQAIEVSGGWKGFIAGEEVNLLREDFEISTQDVPGFLVASDGDLTVALDITLTDDLRMEGIARELVNRVQNLRKESGLELSDRILLKVDTNDEVRLALQHNKSYICNEVLATDLLFENLGSEGMQTELQQADDARILIEKD